MAKQKKYCRQLGLRDRILTLPLMVAAVLTMLWRDVAGVRELTRMLAREGFLWCDRLQVSQQALSKVLEVFTEGYSLRDRKIRLGSGTKTTPYITLRLIEVKSGKVWHSYLTSVLDPEILPPYVVADLYRKRWRIEREGRWGFPSLSNHAVEDAFNTVKRLLGLSYLWVGSINGVKLQIWGTWLFYAILIDLGDAVADELSLPFDRISLEMIYRGLYHFGVANQKGEATDPVKYFAASENKDLGIVKQKRKNNNKLIVASFPEKQRNTPEFFFSSKSLTYA